MKVMGGRKAWGLGKGQEERPFLPQLSLGHLFLVPSSTLRKRSAIKTQDQRGGCSRDNCLLLLPPLPPLCGDPPVLELGLGEGSARERPCGDHVTSLGRLFSSYK